MSSAPVSSSISMRRTIASSPQTRINDMLGLVLLGFVALMPVPLGANNPLSWAIGASLVGMIGLIYGLVLVSRGESYRVGFSAYWMPVALWSVLIGYLIVQAAPLGAIGVPLAVNTGAGGSLSLSSLSVAPDATVLMALRLAGYGIFLFLCLQVAANRDRALMLAELALFVFTAHALFGLAALAFFGDYLLFFEKWAYEGVATGTFVNRNSFATFLAIGLVVGVGLTLRATTRRRSDKGQRVPRQDERFVHAALLAVCSLIILAALMATQSRMGLFAGLSGSLLILVAAAFKLRSRRWRSGLLITAVAGIGLGVIGFGFGSGTLERLGSVESSADVRLALYRQVLEMIGANWLFGTGGGSFEIAYPLFHRWPVSPDVVWDKAHNTYLSLWSELGIIFGTFPVVVFALLGSRIVVLIVRRQEDWWLPLVALAAIVVIGIHSLVDFSMEIQAVVYALLFVLALGLDTRTRLPRNGQRERQAP